MDILFLNENDTKLPEICHDYEILYVFNGIVEVNMDGVKRTIDSDSVLTINPGTKRSFSADDHALAVIFHISRNRIWRLAIGRTIQLHIDSQANPSVSYSKIKSLAKRTVSYHLSSGITDKLAKYSCCYDLLKEVIENFSNWGELSNTEAMTDSDSRKLAIIEYMHSNYQKQLSLSDYADHFNLTPPYLSRFIKASVGVGFHDLLNETRLQYAIDDMLRTNSPISKIAFDNGFPNFASFNKIFRKIYGLTPSEYRKANSVAPEKDYAPINQKYSKKLRSYLSNTVDQTTVQNDLHVKVDVSTASPYHKYWNRVYSLGPAVNLLNSDVQAHILRHKKDLNYKYLHISGIFSKDLRIDPNSVQGFNFSMLDRVFDFMVENDIIPFVDIGFQPWGMIGQLSTEIVYENTEISNYSVYQYEKLIRGFLNQCIQRYGEDEISKWYFDLFWNTDQLFINEKNPQYSYLSFFRMAYQCVKSLIPDAKIGGCGSYAYSLSDFTQMVSACAAEDLKPDYFTAKIHPYVLTNFKPDTTGKSSMTQSGKHFELSDDPVYVSKKIEQLQNTLTQFGYSPDLLSVVGWNMSLSCRNYLNDSCYRGAYIIKTLISCLGKVNIMSHEGITDLLYEHYSPTLQLFGSYGLLSKSGIRKPAYYAFDFMNRLGNNLISSGPNYIITKGSHSRICIVCHNCGSLPADYYGKYRDDADYKSVSLLTKQDPLSLNFQLSGLQNNKYLVKMFSVDEDHGSVLNEWIKLGYNEVVGRDEIDYLSSICVPRQWSEIKNIQKDILSLSCQLSSNEIRLIQVLPMND